MRYVVWRLIGSFSSTVPSKCGPSSHSKNDMPRISYRAESALDDPRAEPGDIARAHRDQQIARRSRSRTASTVSLFLGHV